MDQWLISICSIHLECDAWLHALQSHRNGLNCNGRLVWCTSKRLKCFFFDFSSENFHGDILIIFFIVSVLFAYKSQSNAYHLLSPPHRSHSSKVHCSDCGNLSHCFPLKIFKMFWKCFASKSVNLRWMPLANVLPKQFFVVQFINEKLTQIMDGITYFVDVGRFVQNEKRNVVCVGVCVCGCFARW